MNRFADMLLSKLSVLSYHFLVPTPFFSHPSAVRHDWKPVAQVGMQDSHSYILCLHGHSQSPIAFCLYSPSSTPATTADLTVISAGHSLVDIATVLDVHELRSHLTNFQTMDPLLPLGPIR